MQTNHDFVAHYCNHAPLALALERSLESAIYVGRPLNKPVLDLGCGDGIFVEITFGKNFQLDYGLDPHPTEIERAKQRNVYQHLIHSTGNQIPLENESISTVISNSVMEHIEEISPVLKEAHRILKKNGELHMTVPTDFFDQFSTVSTILRALKLRSLDLKFRNFYNHFWNHFHFYNQNKWKALLKENGFECVEVKEYSTHSETLIHDLLVPFALPAFVVNKIFKRYFIFPKLRRFYIRFFRWSLPKPTVTFCSPGTGGLIYLRSVKI